MSISSSISAAPGSARPASIGCPSRVGAPRRQLAEWRLHEADAVGRPAQRELARKRLDAAPRRRGLDVGVGPVAHPPDPQPPAVGRRDVLVGQAGVEVLAVVHPERQAVGVVVDEARAVERADEVLRARAADAPARVEVHVEHPAHVLRVAVDRQREEVGALPRAAGGACGAEVAQHLPALEIGRGEEPHLALAREHADHDPALRGLVPEHLRVAMIAARQIEHRVARVLRPGAPAIVAERQVLRLPLLGVARVDRDEARRARAVPHSPLVFEASTTALPEKIMMPSSSRMASGQMLPSQQVAADGVAPAHMPPLVALGVVLVEEVVLAVEEDQPVRVVHEVLSRA